MSSELQKRMLQYAPQPPASVWEGISTSLDEPLNTMVAQKLGHFEAVPPPAAWAAIEKKLAGAVPIHRAGSFSWKKIAVAAALLIAVAVSFIFLGRDPVQQSAGNAGHSQPAPAATNEPSVADVNPNGATNSNISGLRPGQKAYVSAGKDDQKKNTVSKTASGQPTRISEISSPQAASLSYYPAFIPEHAEPKAIAVSSIPVEKYMVYSDGEGEAMRLSKKLFNFFECVKEEIFCAQVKKQLQEKIASYSTTSDFTGIVDLLRNLKEN